ncbi:MAG: hypothetical protein HY721_06100 [Planctomycetes bacterium]|nr:hypothetical protein [Planctomycetota bacterium]
METPAQHGPAGNAEPSAPTTFHFLGVVVGGPLEELRATAEKWIRMHRHLGEEANAERTERAYELARSRLEAALVAPPVPSVQAQPSSQQASRPGRPPGAGDGETRS